MLDAFTKFLRRLGHGGNEEEAAEMDADDVTSRLVLTHRAPSNPIRVRSNRAKVN